MREVVVFASEGELAAHMSRSHPSSSRHAHSSGRVY
jgi:hypothetical protein